jgi:demethylmenaquinone methyltransferase / 2-methoxy-6-polyprenyl-1,4-benzoquinol methylase
VALRAEISTQHGKSRYVRRLFATIADRYDLITVVLSYGLDRRWKRRLASLVAPRQSDRALDLACGTGDIAFEIASRGARVAGLDITERMIELASRRSAGRVRFLVGDMLALPFPAESFDLITTGYGIRNVPDIDAALREIHRVLRPGGRLGSLDFNRPRSALVRGAYLAYLTLVGSTLGFLLHRDPDTYRYIPESIRGYPGADRVAGMMMECGFARARWIPLLGGLMAINLAEK